MRLRVSQVVDFSGATVYDVLYTSNQLNMNHKFLRCITSREPEFLDFECVFLSLKMKRAPPKKGSVSCFEWFSQLNLVIVNHFPGKF